MDSCDYCGRPIGFYGCPTHGVDCYDPDLIGINGLSAGEK